MNFYDNMLYYGSSIISSVPSRLINGNSSPIISRSDPWTNLTHDVANHEPNYNWPTMSIGSNEVGTIPSSYLLRAKVKNSVSLPIGQVSMLGGLVKFHRCLSVGISIQRRIVSFLQVLCQIISHLLRKTWKINSDQTPKVM